MPLKCFWMTKSVPATINLVTRELVARAGGGFEGAFQNGDLGDIFGDLFGDIFGSSRGRRRRSGSGPPGNDLQYNCIVSFEEAAFGAKKTVSINRYAVCDSCHGSGGHNGAAPQDCPTCHGRGEIRRQQGFFTVSTTCPRCAGSGQVIRDPCRNCQGEGRKRKRTDLEIDIPAGIDSNQSLKLSGKGDAGIRKGHSGDLYIVVQVKEHQVFEREQYDVHCDIPISFSQAALGHKVEVPTLHGKVELSIPHGTQSGRKMRLKGKGIQKLGSHGLGDQILTIRVETPSKLSVEQKELFKELARLEKKANNPMGQSFFEKVKALF